MPTGTSDPEADYIIRDSLIKGTSVRKNIPLGRAWVCCLRKLEDAPEDVLRGKANRMVCMHTGRWHKCRTDEAHAKSGVEIALLPFNKSSCSCYPMRCFQLQCSRGIRSTVACMSALIYAILAAPLRSMLGLSSVYDRLLLLHLHSAVRIPASSVPTRTR